jgi:NADPH:quinone reductase-like Zn-dependent oxidoreductase
MPEAFMTAYQLLFFIAQLVRGESVLLHAAASSIGQAAIQMCVQRGIKVYVTTRSVEKLDICLALGATAGVVVGSDYHFATQVQEANGGMLVDVVLDPVGATYLKDNLKILQYDGRLVSYGLLSGGIVPNELNSDTSSSPTFLKQLLFKRISFLASTLRARSVEYKANLITALLLDHEAGYPAVSSGRIHVNISKVFPMADAARAHAMMGRNENIGKIILEVKSPETPSMSISYDEF